MMLTLIDTVIGFTVIMLLLSYIVKSLTSVVKNHVQYYEQNLRKELAKLLEPLANVTVAKLEKKLGGIDWRNVGDELLDKNTLEPILRQIDSKLDLSDLEARLKVHKAALQFAFDRRMKNLSLACGTALCLLLNINAFSIWKTLYEDDEIRAKFASDEYVEEMLERGEETAPPPPGPPPSGEDLKKDWEEWREELEGFRREVNFGIGAVWTTPKVNPAFVFYQFLGSLLTGFLVSVGAPYLHDLLRAMSSLRKKSGTAPAG